MKKILIIGGAGYIGNVIIKNLLINKYEIIVLDRFIYDHRNSFIQKNKNLKLIQNDFNNLKILDTIINEISDVIILAGLVGDPITKKYEELSNKINQINTKKLIDYLFLQKLNKVIFVSTCSNYGFLENNKKANEDTQLNPLSIYAKNKVNIEKYILSKKNKTNVCPIILRFATAFGLSDRMRFDLTVNQFTIDILFRKKLLIYDSDTWRPYCHVKDFARVMNIILNYNKDNIAFEIFNAGSDKNNYTKQEIIEKILSKLPFENIKYEKNGVDKRNYFVDFSKIKKILNFDTLYDIEYGIDEIVNQFNKKKFNDYLSNQNKYGNFNIDLNIL